MRKSKSTFSQRRREQQEEGGKEQGSQACLSDLGIATLWQLE